MVCVSGKPQFPVPRSTNPPGTTTLTKTVTTKGKMSTEQDIAAVSGKIAD